MAQDLVAFAIRSNRIYIITLLGIRARDWDYNIDVSLPLDVSIEVTSRDGDDEFSGILHAFGDNNLELRYRRHSQSLHQSHSRAAGHRQAKHLSFSQAVVDAVRYQRIHNFWLPHTVLPYVPDRLLYPVMILF